jgi:hypothetical protein
LKELCLSDKSSDIAVSSMHTNEIVGFYRDNFFNARQFEEGYVTAEDEDIPALKK